MSIGVKHIWSDTEIAFIKTNWKKLTNKQLADGLGLTLTITRTKCYELGLRRMELEFWTKRQVSFLKKHYRAIGDQELSEIYQSKWFKNKGWSKKHIEKKRRYLRLSRTDAERKVIHQRNKIAGRFAICSIKRWIATGQAEEGEIRFWEVQPGKLAPRIKISGKWVSWNRWAWEQHFEEIPNGMNVVFKDNTPSLNHKTLELLTNSDLMKRNSIHNYPKELFDTIHLKIKLNKNIKKHLKRINDEK